ncbi:MAG: S-4TM family putative pore-forming effector [Candidatus Obscuribacterales bacterium]|nr:S-4TM family putative pore-forming effector [Candidatus Obscuribacterales bacterium]
MTGATILVKQNEDLEIKRLAAMRQLYSEEKWIIGLQFWLAVGGSFGILTWKSLAPSNSTAAAATGIVISLVDCFILQHLRGKRRKDAAKIQEQFDCDVLDLSWNRDLIGEELRPELVIEAAARHPQTGYESLKNWYLGRLQEVPFEAARIICQTTNVAYDRSLRERYIKVLVALVLAIFFTTLIVCIVQKIPTDQWLVNFIGPLSPILSFSGVQYREHTEVINKISELRTELQKTWGLCRDSEPGTTELTRLARNLQNKIFFHRSTGVPLFDKVYWRYRGKQELYGEALANQMVDEYLKAKGSDNTKLS